MRRVEYTEGEEVPLRQRDLERKLRVGRSLQTCNYNVLEFGRNQ